MLKGFAVNRLHISTKESLISFNIKGQVLHICKLNQINREKLNRQNSESFIKNGWNIWKLWNFKVLHNFKKQWYVSHRLFHFHGKNITACQKCITFSSTWFHWVNNEQVSLIYNLFQYYSTHVYTNGYLPNMALFNAAQTGSRNKGSSWYPFSLFHGSA